MSAESNPLKFFTFFCAFALTFALVGLAGAQGPPKRSTHYSGTFIPGMQPICSSVVEYDHEDRFDSDINMTIEAWVYRERNDVTETIISYNNWNSIDSFWFGFAGRYLRFYRSGGEYADSNISVPIRAWTHVAVTYTGETVRFYMAGVFLGSASLSNDGANKVRNLILGGTFGGIDSLWLFRGYLDEVRLWSVRRTEDEIHSNMYVEVRDAPGLEAVFGGGGVTEDILAVTGRKGPGVTEEIIGILPRDLVVPLYPPLDAPLTLDGNVDIQMEYAGAEQMVIRYRIGNDIMDGTAYLVYTCGRDPDGLPDRCNKGDEDEYLYIGIRDLQRPPDWWPLERSWVNVNIDPNGSRDEFAQSSDFQIRAFLNEDPAKWLQGDGAGGFVEPLCPLNCPPGDDKWMVRCGPPPNEFGAPTIEMRIHLSLLGLVSDQTEDGIAIIHKNLEHWTDYPAPADAVENSPATWARMRYGEIAWPSVTISGHVYDTNTSTPAAGHTVELGWAGAGAVPYSQTTDANGAYSFNRPVPSGRDIWVRVAQGPCDGCQLLTPIIGGVGEPPVSILPTTVEFDSLEEESVQLASVDFIYRHVGPISLTGMNPTSGARFERVRESPTKDLSPDTVTIEGENLHGDIQVFLSKCGFWLIGCDMGTNWFEAVTVAHSDDWSSVTVEVPAVPKSEWQGEWRWVVRDWWERPGRVEWTRLEDLFTLTHHEYPLVHGFEFDNYEGSARWQDFDGVFGRNGWIGCFRDPLYVLYFIVYENWVESSGGSCNGMSATSLIFAHEWLDPEDNDFDTDETEVVHFASGLAKAERTTWRDEFCMPYRPVNLTAHIRVNHGVQTSAEYIQATLDQMSGYIQAGGSIDGDAVGVLDRVREHPQDYLVSMMQEIDRGHVVTPYAVTDQQDRDGNYDEHKSRIWIYDNNFPQDEPLVRRSIEINYSPGLTPRYYLPRKTNPADDDDSWWGHGIYSIPISIFRNSRTAPGLLTLALVIHVLVFGNADSNVTSPDGEWGWRQDGTLVDNLPGARSITPTGGPNTSTRAVSLFLPIANSAPTINSNVRGPHYFFHAANSGRMFQLEQFNGVNGDRDGFQTGYDNEMLDRVSFTPQSRADNFRMRIGMITGDQKRAVFESAGLDVSGGQTAGFKALPGRNGIELTNDTSNAVNPMYTVTTLDGASAIYAENSFGPFDVPAGAVQRVTVADWPTSQRLRSEIDLDRDGVFDLVSVAPPTTIVPPRAPDQLTTSLLTPTSIRLNWRDNSSDERGFLIERKTGLCASESDWRQIAVTGSNTTTYTDNDVLSAATYSYRLRAYSGYVHSPYTRCVSLTTSDVCEDK
jgi:hypothetical protein